VVDSLVIEDAASAILADVKATGRLGADTTDAVQSMAENLAVIEFYGEEPPDAFAMALAEDVQQWLHDTFQDTSWPHCPDHPNYPLWLDSKDGDRPRWRCPATGGLFGPLGRIGPG
jgi:hypothetical protein